MSVRAALSTDQVQLTGYQYPLVEAFRESVVHVHVASEGNWKHRAMGISFSMSRQDPLAWLVWEIPGSLIFP